MKKIEFFKQVIELVSSKTDITEEQMLSMRRTADVLDARAIVVFYCRKFGLSNGDIQSLFGRQGHHFVQRMCDLCDSRRKTSRYYSSIFAAIGTQLGFNM